MRRSRAAGSCGGRDSPTWARRARAGRDPLLPRRRDESATRSARCNAERTASRADFRIARPESGRPAQEDCRRPHLWGVFAGAEIRHAFAVRDLPGLGGQRRVSIALALLCAVFTVTFAAIVAVDEGASAVSCAAWASPRGSDANPGTRARPYRRVGRLAASLKPGQRGCLEPGATFDERIVLNVSGAPHAPVTIASGPGPRAILAQGIELASSARYVHLESLTARARKGTPSEVATVVLRGYAVYIERERCDRRLGRRRPAHLHPARSRRRGGHRAQHHPPLRGGPELRVGDHRQHLRQRPHHRQHGVRQPGGRRRARSERSALSHHAKPPRRERGRHVFGGAAKYASRDNRITRNVVTESRRFAVHGSYKQGAPVGSGNLVLDNCVWRTARMGGDGYTAARNRVVDPRVVPVARGYRLAPGSPCTRYHAGA